jgi:hypothetical protein
MKGRVEMDPAEIKDLNELISTMDEHGFDTHEAIDFINDSLPKSLISKIIKEICVEYHRLTEDCACVEVEDMAIP